MLEAEATAEALAIGRRDIDSPRVLLRVDALRVRTLVPDLALSGPSPRPYPLTGPLIRLRLEE